jgi:hypothetical protein
MTERAQPPRCRASSWKAATSIAASSPYDHQAGEADTEQRHRSRLGYGGREFCDDDLAVTNAKIGHQDLVYAGIEGAAATTRPKIAHSAIRAAAAAAVAAPATGRATGSYRCAAAAAATEAAVGSARAPSETRECATAAASRSGAASAEKATAATAPHETASGTTIAPGAAPWAAAVQADEAPLAGVRDRPQDAAAATAATAGYDERRVTGTDDESATTAAASFARHTHAADGDLQGVSGGQAKIAADLGASAAGADTVSALRAEGKDLISVGCRHRETRRGYR